MTPPLPPEDWPLRSASRAVASAPHRWHLQVTGTGPEILFAAWRGRILAHMAPADPLSG